MSESKYTGSNNMSYEERRQLFSNVLGLDYIKGPKVTFDVKNRLSAINDTLVDKVIKSTQTKSSSEGYRLSTSDCLSSLVDLHLVAEFYLELQNQAPEGKISGGKVVLNSFEGLASYADNTNALYADNTSALAVYFPKNRKSCFVREDDSGRKYIELTAAGEKAFSEIWNCNDNYMHSDVEISLSKLKGMKKDLVYEKNEDFAIVVDKEENTPSILAQNRFSSTAPWSADKVPDESIIGSRKSIKGSFLTGTKS